MLKTHVTACGHRLLSASQEAPCAKAMRSAEKALEDYRTFLDNVRLP